VKRDLTHTRKKSERLFFTSVMTRTRCEHIDVPLDARIMRMPTLEIQKEKGSSQIIEQTTNKHICKKIATRLLKKTHAKYITTNRQTHVRNLRK